ncbi:oligosaccharide repeat unit polymerase [Anoxybacillus pushchinoensis]|uniref:Oligosaccharide repeat unit polymerase n=1 Tax=Anoxybacillus pushchinoensis TaxID=150248 RepID=A0A1I0U4I7_9BACL|nr:DUF6337 family protein [Anoxybacillus pushchinoensis]SFA59029.1 oligosaccharide repeat unit polymerase [Anoxybacillus pushchinoensis]
MINWFLLLIYSFIVYTILRIEKKKFGNLFTPYFFLVIPFLVICFLNIILGSLLGFKIINYKIILYWILYSTVFFIGGTLLFPFTNKDLKYENSSINNNKNNNIVSIFSILISLYLIKAAFDLISTHPSIHYIASDLFAKDYGQGILAYLRVGAMICLIYLIGFYERVNIIMGISIIITLIPFLIYQVKGIILIPIIAGIIFRTMLGNLRSSLKLIIISLSLGIIIFIVVYSIPYIYMRDFDNIMNKNFILEKLRDIFAYLFSGILGFSGYLESGMNTIGDSQRIIAPLWNLLRHITYWDRVDSVVTEYFFPIDKDNLKVSNVFTLFGTIHIYLGVWVSIFISILIGFISYIFKMWSNNSVVWLKVNYCFNLSILSFGWFDYNYYHSYIWLFWIFVTLLTILYYTSRLRF